MSSIGTFGAFTTARLGIYAAQKALSVTGNNIANINTPGYTRQALDQLSLKVGASDRYHSQYDVKVGSGVLSVGVSQIRDPYLDIRYRSEASKVGALNAKLTGLNDIAAILDEVGMGDDEHGRIYAQLEELDKAIRSFSDAAGEKEYDTQVREAASALVSLINTAARDLKEVEENTITHLDQDVEAINNILTNIRDLNSAIRKSDIHGDNALEMRDERNLLIDQLSEYMKVDVIYTDEEIGAGQKVEKLTLRLGNANPDPTIDTDTTVLVDGSYAAQLSVKQPRANPDYDENDPDSLQYLKADDTPTNNINEAIWDYYDNYNVTVSALEDRNGIAMKVKDEHGALVDSKEVVLDDNDLYGSLQSTREILTEKGEFSSAADLDKDEKAAVKRGLPYYQMSLDLLAKKLASEFNKANNDFLVNEKGNYIKENGEEIEYLGNPISRYDELTDKQRAERYAFLEKEGGVKMGGNLFSNSGDSSKDDGITAENLSIALDWANGETHVVTSYVKPHETAVGTTHNQNILHLTAILDKPMVYNPKDINPDAKSDYLFKGDFSEMFNNMNSVLANDMRSTNTLLTNAYTSAVDLDTSRDSVSGVDLNDEAMNLMQFQKSYAAACRLMTTLDEALDKLINGTGIVGR